MDFPPFEHLDWLARAWAHDPPRHNLGASGFQSPVLADLLPAAIEPDDVSFVDLHGGASLQAALARRAGMDADQVRVTSGTSGANAAVLASLIAPGCNVVVERPTYTPLASLARGFGAEVRWVDRGLTWDLDHVEAACDEQTAAILCTSPNNPTGAALTDQEFSRLGNLAASYGAVVLCDQVYQELTDHPLGATCHDAIISTSGMNKCWGAGGLRVGWAVGRADLMERVQATHRVLAMAPGTFATRIALHLLDHEDACRDALQQHLDGAHALYRAWADGQGLDGRATGLTAFPAVPDSMGAAKRLLQAGIVTVPGEVFEGPGHLRLGFGIPLPALQEALVALGSNL